jgi:glutathione S-transferase
MLRLITIPISHYCEKARWALDRASLRYDEERHVQGVHRVYARRAGGGATVPVLVTPEGALGESREIIEWVDQRTPPERRLLPPDAAARGEVEALCRRFDERLGPAGRRLIYVHVLGQRAVAAPFNNNGVPRWEDRAIRYGWPLAARFIRQQLGITAATETDDEAAVFDELEFVARRLADGRQYLSGDSFSAADLTFAALSAPVTAPPEYGVALPQPDQLAPRTAALIERAREHPAGRYALRMFAEHRGERVAA